MAVIATPNQSSVKIIYHIGTGLEGEEITKSKTYSSIKSSTINDDLMAVINSIVSLQDHTTNAVNRIDNTSLTEE